MTVCNMHSRRIAGSVDTLAALLDGLASTDDRLWPTTNWPPMRLDRPLGVGAAGGHGPIRYTVRDYLPGRRVRFEFNAPSGFAGFHEFALTDAAGAGEAVLTHRLAIRPHGVARISWLLVYRWLHDALLEDALDRAELAATGGIRSPARWSRYVRVLRTVLALTTRGRGGPRSRP